MPETSITNPQALPVRPPETVLDFGSTLVVAPHQDDESLGCGGAIALLRQAGLDVKVLFISDGSGSHPGSARYPAPALTALRNGEALQALEHLGVAAEDVTFMGLRDRFVPSAGASGFEESVAFVRELVTIPQPPQTVLLPWRRDPHTDHRAAWEIMNAAFDVPARRPRMLEYPIWVWDLGDPEDLPAPDEMRGWRLDISEVLPQKLRAIAAHRSQTTPMIDDDPVGWYLRPETLARFRQPWEVYLEPVE